MVESFRKVGSIDRPHKAYMGVVSGCLPGIFSSLLATPLLESLPGTITVPRLLWVGSLGTLEREHVHIPVYSHMYMCIAETGTFTKANKRHGPNGVKMHKTWEKLLVWKPTDSNYMIT